MKGIAKGLLLALALVGCKRVVPETPVDTPAVGAVAPAEAPNPVGVWGGVLSAGPVNLRLVLEVEQGQEGLQATLVSLDQGGARIDGESVSLEGDTFRASFPAIRAVYQATVAGDSMKGMFMQGAPMGLDLERNAQLEPVTRPQDPTGELPYTAVEQTVDAGEHTLACTLTLPPGEGPHPAVVLVTGSGGQDRDEAIMGHRPFLVVADHLARSGTAALRCDDRGVGASTGTFVTATSSDFADDALAAVAHLRARSDMGPVGIVGHSEGGYVGPIAAQRGEVDFLVLLAPLTVPIEQLMADQSVRLGVAEGIDPAAYEASRAERQRFYDKLGDPDVSLDEMVALAKTLPGGSSVPEEALRANLTGMHTTPWLPWLRAHPPEPYLRAIDVPTLALFGGLDLQVHPSISVPALEQATKGKPVTIEVLDGLNHLFQPATTGGMSEYGTIETTFDPAALARISGWIGERG